MLTLSGPGSFFEVTRMLPLLADNKDGPAFHVVAPSLANFGFSSRITKVKSIYPVILDTTDC
jgi:pimeloyl-ACP methyl ester carboxylesterase